MFRHELEPSLGPEHNLYLICNRKIILFQRVFVTRFDEYERSLILNALLIERILILFHFLTRGLEFNFADEFSLFSQAHTLLTQQFRLGLKWFLIIASHFCHSFSLPLFSFVRCVLCRRVIFYVSVICLTNIENHFSFSNAAAAVLRKKCAMLWNLIVVDSMMFDMRPQQQQQSRMARRDPIPFSRKWRAHRWFYVL